MSWGTVTIGGVSFRETLVAEQSGDTVRIVGQESHPPSTVSQVEAAHHNVSGLGGLAVPVVFTDKAGLTGFYRVADAASTLTRVHNGAVQTADWSVSLERLGGSRDVEIESRVPTIGRLTDHAVTPVFWHAPAVGADSYWTGTTVPSGSVSRASIDGTVLVHTGIPSGVAPRWTAEAGDYLGGAVRLLVAGIRRVGSFTPDAAVWEVHNGLVRLSSPGMDGAFSVSCWDGTDWRSEKSYRVVVSGVPLAMQPDMTVLRNDPEEVMVRLSYPTSSGRLTVDLGVRRGSRFVSGLLKRHSAATVRIERTAAEAASAVTGGLKATAADADGNRFVMGSARTVTTSLATAYISKATTTVFDFFLGHEVGASPAAGDAFADLLAQYLGAAGSERARVVRR